MYRLYAPLRCACVFLQSICIYFSIVPPFAFFAFFVTKKKYNIFPLFFPSGSLSGRVLLTSKEFCEFDIIHILVYIKCVEFFLRHNSEFFLSLLLFRAISLRSRLTISLCASLRNLRHTHSHTRLYTRFFSIAIYTIELLLVFNLLPPFLQPE